MASHFVLIAAAFSLSFSSAYGSILASEKPVYNETVALSNYNTFKNNLDNLQEFVINLYQGVYGGLSGFWVYWPWWMIASGFLYTFSVSYEKAKEEAELEIKEFEAKMNGTATARDLSFSSIDLDSIYNKFQSIDQRMGGKLSDSCYKRGVCEMRSYFSTTTFYHWIPKWMRRMLRLEVNSREVGSCGKVHHECSIVNLLSTLIQGAV